MAESVKQESRAPWVSLNRNLHASLQVRHEKVLKRGRESGVGVPDPRGVAAFKAGRGSAVGTGEACDQGDLARHLNFRSLGHFLLSS